MHEHDTYEDVLTRGLQELADEAPRFRGLRRQRAAAVRRPGRWAPVAAAVAVASVVAAGYGSGLLSTSSDHQPQPPAQVGPAAADDSSSTPTPLPGLASKDEVRAVADPLAGLYDKQGFGKVALDFSAREVRVWWKGTPPPEVLSAEGMSASGVRVLVLPAPFSDSELKAAAQRIADGAAAMGLTANMVAQADDLSGLIAYLSANDLKSRDVTALGLELARIAKVPVDVKEGEGVHFQ